MEYNTYYNKIITDENLMETVKHGKQEYPFQFYYDKLRLFDFNCIDWHWHTEIEFVYVEKGTVTFSVGENEFELAEGNGLFINSKVLHRFYSADEGIIPNFVFLPSLIAEEESLLYKKYVQPIINSGVAYEVLSKDISWQLLILEKIREIISVQKGNELLTVSLLQQMWNILYENIDIKGTNEDDYSSLSQVRLQLMLQYINSNYANIITLNDIAEYVQVSKSTALNLFNRFIHTTPINYLINYRLSQAAKLLRNTEKKIYAVARETGFESTGYFCRKFKENYYLTPSDYRRKRIQN